MSPNGHSRDVDTATSARRRDIDAPEVDTDQETVADFQGTIGNRATNQLLLAFGGHGVYYSPGPSFGGPTTKSVPTKPAKPPWYQEILDRIVDEQKNVVTLSTGTTFGGDALSWMNEVKDVALALDAKDVKATKAAIKVLLKDQPTPLLPYVISEHLDHEMAARAFALGLGAEAMDLVRYFRRRNEYREPPAYHQHSYAEDREMWERVTREATVGGAPKDAAAASHLLDKIQPAFTAMALEFSSLDPGRVEGDYAMRHDPSIGLLAGPYDQSISEYHATLKELVDKLYAQIETCEQLLIDDAELQLEKGHGEKALDVAKRAHASIDVAISSVKDEVIDITKSKFGKPGKHFDYFGGKADKARAIGISFLDTSQTEGKEMRHTYGRVAEERGRQLAFLARLYGLEKKDGKLTEDAASNEAAIKAMRGDLKLHDNDSWRQFLAAKLKGYRAAGVSDADALDKMLDLVKAYFKAFAVHTPYNIEEFGDNYLTKSFPRTLSGQLLQDCGVYALRIVYMLSLVRKELKLNIQFIVLPAHVGLILTGEKGTHLPTYVIQNDTFSRFSEKDIAAYRDRWLNTDTSGNPLSKPQKPDDVQFMGELAAATFADADSPFKVENVPQLTAANTTLLKEKYFDLYHERALKKLLVDEAGKKGIKNFEQRYVKLADRENALSDRVVPFWNERAPAIWGRHKGKLLDALNGVRTHQLGKGSYQAVRDAYLNELKSKGQPLLDTKSDLLLEGIDIGETLEKHPKLLDEKARKFPKLRWMNFSGETDRALDDLQVYFFELETENDLDDPDKAKRLEPPFMQPGRKIVLD